MVGAKVKFLYIDKYVYVQFYAICNGEYERIIIIDGIYDRLIYTMGLNRKIFCSTPSSSMACTIIFLYHTIDIDEYEIYFLQKNFC